jgi:hypothetical protein
MRPFAHLPARWARSLARSVARCMMMMMRSYFATIHLEATKILADVAVAAGQRAHIGLVNMDRNAPE